MDKQEKLIEVYKNTIEKLKDIKQNLQTQLKEIDDQVILYQNKLNENFTFFDYYLS